MSEKQDQEQDPAVVAAKRVIEVILPNDSAFTDLFDDEIQKYAEIIRTAYAERERWHAEVVRILNELYQSTTLSNDGQRLEILVPSELAYAMRDALDAETNRLIQDAKAREGEA